MLATSNFSETKDDSEETQKASNANELDVTASTVGYVPFKQANSFEKRRLEAQRIMDAYPNKVPLIVERQSSISRFYNSPSISTSPKTENISNNDDNENILKDKFQDSALGTTKNLTTNAANKISGGIQSVGLVVASVAKTGVNAIDGIVNSISNGNSSKQEPSSPTNPPSQQPLIRSGLASVVSSFVGKSKELPEINKKKFLCPGDITVGQFQYIIRKRFAIQSNENLFLIIAGKYLAPTSSLLSQVYEDYHDDDGFLYITYAAENTFG